MYAVVFRFGAFQVSQEPGSIAHADFETVFVAFTALVFGAIGAGQAGAFAPNYAKAKLSADRIFFLLDRVPVIDGYSQDGDKPVSMAHLYAVLLITMCRIKSVFWVLINERGRRGGEGNCYLYYV